MKVWNLLKLKYLARVKVNMLRSKYLRIKHEYLTVTKRYHKYY